MNVSSDGIDDELLSKLFVLDQTAWESRVQTPQIEHWLNNFGAELPVDDRTKEKQHALYLLSQFIYFGSREMRELLKALYRDLFRYPLIEQIRRKHADTTDVHYIEWNYRQELSSTRFLGIGNPAESGCHLLYYFRQENGLDSKLFIHGHQVFKRGKSNRRELRYPQANNYVFIDDLCGSGDQAREYSKDIVRDVKRLNPNARVSYLVLFATGSAIKRLKKTAFDQINAVVELDESFRVFGKRSRYFKAAPKGIKMAAAKQLSLKYGSKLVPAHPLGYKSSQLLLGFHHNTPDNTLPIMWCDDPASGDWIPVFKRYPKYL